MAGLVAGMPHNSPNAQELNPPNFAKSLLRSMETMRLRGDYLWKFIFRSSLSHSRHGAAQEIVLKGRVVDPAGSALPNASVQLSRHNQVLALATPGPTENFCKKPAFRQHAIPPTSRKL